MTRYRLRFLLQEIDLPPGVTTIGRGLGCQVTLDDPLVSRQHARIVVDEGGAIIEDSGSRNGVVVNGSVIREPTRLVDGDRVRIGTQEFVFCRFDPTAATPLPPKKTGQLRVCANCGQLYPREMIACPQCEDTEEVEEDTVTDAERPRPPGTQGASAHRTSEGSTARNIHPLRAGHRSPRGHPRDSSRGSGVLFTIIPDDPREDPGLHDENPARSS